MEQTELEDFKVTLPEGAEFSEFRPVAYFDKHMDCIRVLTHDRSVTEHRVSEFITLFEPNHRERFDPEFVGFAIKGIRRLFHDAGLPLEGVYKLAELIDKLVSHKPGSVVSTMLRLVYKDYESQGDLTIHFDDDEGPGLMAA